MTKQLVSVLVDVFDLVAVDLLPVNSCVFPILIVEILHCFRLAWFAVYRHLEHCLNDNLDLSWCPGNVLSCPVSL